MTTTMTATIQVDPHGVGLTDPRMHTWRIETAATQQHDQPQHHS